MEEEVWNEFSGSGKTCFESEKLIANSITGGAASVLFLTKSSRGPLAWLRRIRLAGLDSRFRIRQMNT